MNSSRPICKRSKIFSHVEHELNFDFDWHSQYQGPSTQAFFHLDWQEPVSGANLTSRNSPPKVKLTLTLGSWTWRGSLIGYVIGSLIGSWNGSLIASVNGGRGS